MNAPLSTLRSHQVPWLLLLLYFGAHILSRILVSDALELDEAEQALWTQHLAAGYGTQPPLYTWLQWTVFQVAGVSVLSLSLLKNALLAATYAFVWLAARRLMAAPLALLAAASMLLIPQIGWESQRDLTHSVLATAIAAATLCIVVRLIEKPCRALYPALGLCAALGLLSKYSFALFLVALVLALLLSREARPVLRSPWIIAAVLVALVVLAPHALWLFDNWHVASARTLEKLGASTGLTAGLARGVGSLLGAALATLGALAFAGTAIFGRAAWQDGAASAHCRLWRRYFGALAALMLGLVLVGGATHFKGRWLQPLVFMAPLAFFCCRPRLAAHPRLSWLRGTLIALALLYLFMASMRPVFDGWRNRPDELNEPAAELADALRGAGYDGRTPIVTHDPVLGGVLRVRFPQARVTVWQEGLPEPAPRFAPHLLIGRNDDGRRLFERAAAAPVHRLALHPLHARPERPPIEYRYAFMRSTGARVQSRPAAP
ncbi:glycosyltransferase family 39 protein [Methyloversatilis sp. XJ19-13]|uniref:glycosyltransferase family 39 protein n=1 Tax=Methyloversatilis sp. XJ19-13 TaxID=2963430 RepID=UPI00211B7ACC|nr:glycosyltransferase family 39 protein [Methyloversatilis sp. XJ19-13]MCQ9374557.1 glycosyltransferase family 39 protein [Methyloversatilis sp. XJ19-13]